MGNYAKGFIAICCLFDLDTTLLGVQSNGLMAGLIILSVGLLERNKYLWAAFCLVASIYIKLFGAVGLALFLLYPRQGKLALYTLFWAAVLGAAPLIFVSPAQYGDLLVSYWNLLAQDHAASAGISLIGLLNATLALPVNKSAAVLIGAVIFMLPFCRIKNYTDVKFRLLMLCAVLIWVIIFNHRTESATLIIATVGMALWFVVGEKNAMNLVLFIAALSLTSLALTGVAAWFLWQWLGDRWKIYPAVAVGAAVLLALVASDIYFGFPLKMIYRAYIEPYSLRIAPCILIWLKLTCDLLAGKFSVAGEIEEPLKIKN
ncbi:hypothetical protein FACS1894108_00780 [Planctomycetales bacterium]|nr:hypothetical protein FACS1894108_00780 [Planctomycetales bacterium]